MSDGHDDSVTRDDFQPEVEGVAFAQAQGMALTLTGLATMLSMVKDGVDVAQASQKAFGRLETLEIAVLSAFFTSSEYQVVMQAHNYAIHGVYIEHIELEQAQSREGPPDAPARYRVAVVDERPRVSSPASAPPAGFRPVLLEPDEHRKFEIEIALAPDTWPARDHYGTIVVHVTKLNEAVSTKRRVTFPIRQPMPR